MRSITTSKRCGASRVRLSHEPAPNQAPCSHGPSLSQGGKTVKSRFVSHTLLALFAGSALLTPLAVHAAAPAMLIDKPGAYTLANDIMAASGDAIMITASGVTLDLGGHNVGIATPGEGG